MIEDNKIISRDDRIAKRFSEYFINIPILNMLCNGYKCPDSSEQDPTLQILDEYKDHKDNSEVSKFIKSSLKSF